MPTRMRPMPPRARRRREPNRGKNETAKEAKEAMSSEQCTPGNGFQEDDGCEVNILPPSPRFFVHVQIPQDLKSFIFGTAYSKGVMGAFCGTAHSKELSLENE